METVVLPRLLLVDDEPLVAEVLQAVLDEAGYAVTVAGSATEALTILEAEAGEMAGLVTDVNLTSRTSGWDIARRARELNPTIPVVYVSGDSGQDWSAQGVPRSALLNKPFAPSQLVVIVANQINAAAGEDPTQTPA